MTSTKHTPEREQPSTSEAHRCSRARRSGLRLPDEATLEGDADLLVERGTWMRHGRPEPYVEHWRRVGLPTSILALQRGHARFLEVGDVAVLVTPTAVRRWHREGAPSTTFGWLEAAALGDPDDAFPSAAQEWIAW